MHFTNVLYLIIIFHSCYCESVLESPVFGYHLRVGVPEAFRLQSQESLRIVGGSQVSTADAIPHQAGIIATLTTGWSSVCGGSLISATRILTAAHCWFDGASQARRFTIVLGSITLFSGGTRIDTTDVTMHPSWDYLQNDIAIVRIATVTFTNNIQTIPLPTMAEINLNFVGFTGQISGFGKTSDAQNSFPTTTSLHHTTVSIIANTVCQTSYKVTIHGSQLCTGGTGGKGTCDGDSGGPLTVVHNNRRILFGVVSFGPGEGCQASTPSVFTRITAYLAWINSNL